MDPDLHAPGVNAYSGGDVLINHMPWVAGSFFSISSGGAHTHSFSNVTGSGSGSGSLTIPSLSVNDHTHTVTINNGNDIKFKLNTATTQSTFSVVSKHYKLAYIQRIY